MNKKLTKIVLTALFMALCCAGTFIHIPSPASQGYLNLGDCFVILSGWILGPFYGFLAGGIGSCLSDAILGYTAYVPATLIIKGLMALLAYLISCKAFKEKSLIGRILSGFIAEIIMVGGYYLYEAFLVKSFVTPLMGIPGNVVQGLFGILLSVIIMTILKKTSILEKVKKIG